MATIRRPLPPAKKTRSKGHRSAKQHRRDSRLNRTGCQCVILLKFSELERGRRRVRQWRINGTSKYIHDRFREQVREAVEKGRHQRRGDRRWFELPMVANGVGTLRRPRETWVAGGGTPFTTLFTPFGVAQTFGGIYLSQPIFLAQIPGALRQFLCGGRLATT